MPVYLDGDTNHMLYPEHHMLYHETPKHNAFDHISEKFFKFKLHLKQFPRNTQS